MSDIKPEAPKRAATFASSRSPDPPPSSAARFRGPQRQSSGQNLNGSLSPARAPRLDRRRSSILSYSSIDELTQSLTDDLINPSTSRARNTREEDEVTHWHSTPLAFAILPAVAGLLFKNGSAFVTDILLLGLAAIFMNWSIRLPWDWYYSAQMQRRAVDPDDLPILDDLEVDENHETAVETGSSADNSPKRSPSSETNIEPDNPTPEDLRREDAAAELRRQETIALSSTFLFPILAAYLIHVIRRQLSTSSTGLVSDFNLAIFLLAAEIRPCRQLIRLITNRTLHLQRTVTGLNDPFGSAVDEKAAMNGLASRIAEVEAKLSDHMIVPPTMSLAQKHEVADLSAELRKRYEPRMEALERAMRRYEKRFATIIAQTEQRFGQMDVALQDTLSLAAQAARQSQTGTMARVAESVSALVALPVKVAWGLVLWPVHVLEEAYDRMRAVLVGPAPSRIRRKGGEKQVVGKEEKGKAAAAARKPVR